MTNLRRDHTSRPIIRWRRRDVIARLKELGPGLRPEPLADAVKAGLVHLFDCTLNDAPNFGGLAVWDKSTRRLREFLIPQGWERKNFKNYATTVSPDGQCTIAIAAGNSDTGNKDIDHPTTRTEKGPVTRERVTANAQLSFQAIMASFPLPRAKYITGPTWLLMHYWDEESEVVRIELSMPQFMTARGLVTKWRERIIIGEYQIDQRAKLGGDADQTPEIDISVQRIG